MGTKKAPTQKSQGFAILSQVIKVGPSASAIGSIQFVTDTDVVSANYLLILVAIEYG